MYEDYENYEDERDCATDSVVEDALLGILLGDLSVEDTALEGCDVRSFADAGVMTYDKGLVLRLPDGSEFQVTIIQSR